MGYSSKDLEYLGKGLNTHREQKSKEQGEKLAKDLMDSTSEGRGLWVLILWPTWILITLFIGVFTTEFLEKQLSIEEPISFVGFLVGFMFATKWYQWGFTRRHPFFGSIVGYFGFGIAILFLAEKLGVN